MRGAAGWGLSIAALAAAACAGAPQAGERPAPLPSLPVERISPTAGLERAPVDTIEPAVPLGPPVTFTARDADIRLLIPLLAEAAGMSVVLDPAVEGRVTVEFRDVPALEALEMVLREAGMGIVDDAPPAAPFGPTVFYPLPVAVDEASPEVIAARFGTSLRLARWMVEARRSF